MRRTFTLVCFILLLGISAPADAQLRTDNPAAASSVRLYDTGATGLSLNRFFSPEHFRMAHSLEFSSSSFNGGSSLGMYTTSMMWQFNSKLAARMDVAMAYGGGGASQAFSSTGASNNAGRIFLRNAEVAYRPTKNMQLNLQVRQSPYGSYMSPYGSSRYRGSNMFMTMGSRQHDLFWNDELNR